MYYRFKNLKKEKTIYFNYNDSKLEVKITSFGAKIKGVGAIESYSCHHIENTREHMCGLMGFNPSLGDSCPGCEDFHEHSRILHSLKDYLVKKRYLIKTK